MSMVLTKDNYKIYAMNGYTNDYCLTEREFELDLSKIGTIRKLIATYIAGHTINLRVIVNTVVCFYNVFEYECGTNLMMFNYSNAEILTVFNTILYYLSFPTFQKEIDQTFLNLIINEFEVIV